MQYQCSTTHGNSLPVVMIGNYQAAALESSVFAVTFIDVGGVGTYQVYRYDNGFDNDPYFVDGGAPFHLPNFDLYSVVDASLSSSRRTLLKNVGGTVYFVYSTFAGIIKYATRATVAGAWSAATTIVTKASVEFCDIFDISGVKWLMTRNATNVYFYKLSDGTEKTRASPLAMQGCLVPSDTTKYEYLEDDGGGIGAMYRRVTFDGTDFATGTSVGMAPNVAHGMFFENLKGFKVVMQGSYYMKVWDKFINDWILYDDEDGNGLGNWGFEWGLGLTFPTYIMHNGIIYKPFEAGALIPIPQDSVITTTASEGCPFALGWIQKNAGLSYFVGNKTIEVGENSKCRSGRNIEDKCQFENETEDWQINSLVILSDDLGDVKFQGFIDSYEDNSKVIVRSPIEEELKKKIPAATGVVSTLVTNVIATSPWLTAGTITVTGTSRTWNGGTMDDFFKWAEQVEAFVWNYNALFVSNFDDDGAASGFSYSFGDGKILDLKPYSKNYTINKATYYGSGISSTKYNASAANGQIIQDWFPKVTSQTELDTMLTNFIAKNSVSIISIDIDIVTDNISWGTWITVEYPLEGITSASFFVVNVGYDFKSKLTHLFATSSIIYQLINNTEPLFTDPIDQKINNLGTSSVKDVGTTSGTVAAGDHTHAQLHDQNASNTSSIPSSYLETGTGAPTDSDAKVPSSAMLVANLALKGSITVSEKNLCFQTPIQYGNGMGITSRYASCHYAPNSDADAYISSSMKISRGGTFKLGFLVNVDTAPTSNNLRFTIAVGGFADNAAIQNTNKHNAEITFGSLSATNVGYLCQTTNTFTLSDNDNVNYEVKHSQNDGSGNFYIYHVVLVRQ